MAEDRIRDYIIEGLIGAGGMGMVYLAHHETLKRPAAIKVLLENLSANPQIKERFVQEAQLMGALNHPNIVTLYDFTTSPKLSLIMEFIDGRGLDEMIGKEVGPIPWEKALPLFIQILEGIGYAHSKNVIHRDIKPANILVSKEGKIKITDLGIAKIAGQQGMTRTGAQMGTLYYESPEQIQGARDVDLRSDIYSLGMTLYEMLAGRLPFEGGSQTSEFAIMSSVVHRKDHLDPRAYYPHIPEWLVKTVQKATAIDPEKRFQSCDTFIKVLEKYSNLKTTESTYWSNQVALSVPAVLISPSSKLSISKSEPTSSEDQCPKCKATVKESMEFCGKCGANLQKECPGCQNVIRWHYEFCPKCGNNINEILKEKENVILNKKKRFDDFFSSMEFVNIPSGSFLMGSPESTDTEIKLAEYPQHKVEISSFELMSTQITQKMWMFLMKFNPSHFKSNLSRPVESVSWNDCQLFLLKLNDLDTKYSYRLPSESEWEYACRANSKGWFSWGDSSEKINLYCWSKENSDATTQPVATLRPNDFGLYDMSGNVWEWCEDIWFSNHAGAPTNGNARISSTIQYKIIRGGSWKADANKCRSAYRSAFLASTTKNFLGFRIVRETIDDFFSSMKFVNIPSGSFTMGSPDSTDQEIKIAEYPQHKVEISSFKLMSTQVTQEMWMFLMKSNPSYFQSDLSRPVESVSWDDCQLFLLKLNDLDTKYSYRLPSESEWEYACRANSKGWFSWGDSSEKINLYCWSKENSDATTQPVATLRPNDFGLYDMSGNVWEWCEDIWFSNHAGAPTNGNARISSTIQYKIIRGGSWKADANKCRSAYRSAFLASTTKNFLGFRIIRESKSDARKRKENQRNVTTIEYDKELRNQRTYDKKSSGCGTAAIIGIVLFLIFLAISISGSN